MAELARDRDLVVIPVEEVKTLDQGEVIGLFLREEIPRGMSFGETIAYFVGSLACALHRRDRERAALRIGRIDAQQTFGGNPRRIGARRRAAPGRGSRARACVRGTLPEPGLPGVVVCRLEVDRVVD